MKNKTTEYPVVEPNGDVYIGNGIYARRWTWTAWITLLWIVLSYPLYLGILNAYTPTDTEITPVVIPVEEEVEILEIPEDVDIYIPTEEVILDSVALQFIWETEETFAQSFRSARSLLGPNETFMWHGSLYHTNYKDEFASLD